MLPKTRRLDKKSFTKHFGEGFFVSSPTLSLRVNPLKTHEISRFSVVVPAKVTRNKPKRNTVKRRVYTIIQSFYPSLRASVAGIVFVKKEGLEIPYKALENELKMLFAKARLLN
jgi:ribonuclease P protein component